MVFLLRRPQAYHGVFVEGGLGEPVPRYVETSMYEWLTAQKGEKVNGIQQICEARRRQLTD